MPAARCPMCKRKLDPGAPKPFCSAPCQRIDLARWLGGEYRIPVDSEATDHSSFRIEEAK